MITTKMKFCLKNLEKGIDSALLFATGDSGIAYKIVSHNIDDFEQEEEVER